ncbi:Rrf2 family transcriptional regulator [Roseobacter sp. HKCCD9010]|uniref:RrF2 family transcriptional regulator n=2 Tax=unclassified Roseobacter TaxID=196798 RepID=UPI00149232C3|nr:MULTISPECIES: Rrf2 family transcriptional regulator [unclassified Roseobacter]MBF9050254.1 Rrf2 family transcriptional regulator [Rhodobacterales bacterium HKCCD4356]NNV12497.1 Rrf2 family transcriptional regulator [Roseobacter sp. HKCCD7357]NNV16038.1 Rrf2 family transcriptional regulator [Roseobacter sp. HKCCD8768]NNV25498.1 Rrf2 family transcriptional regulator [Roseobacter sp. HKCCD8192]NNV29755.1 Rrf2 family transcriptional regulator [Roseobacter sp. HKCCD9061]
MKRNSRLSLALHALGHMAAEPRQPRTSTEIAEHNQTNPVFVRRVLGLLREAGLLVSEKGPRGGWLLAHAPEDISLTDVYLALGERFMRPDPDGTDNPPQCLVERELRTEVDAALSAAEATLTDHLSRVPISRLGAVLRRP